VSLLRSVQEQLIGEQNEAGRVPRAVECELTSDLVDVAVPGELVTVSGVVKVESVEPERRKGLP
jgi:DNA helicase MCM8